MAVNAALSGGYRGLPGGVSLARLLFERRGSRSLAHLPPVSIPQILGWADAFRARNGRWPNASSGLIAETPGETWGAINLALQIGYRGLPPGCSLIRLLIQERGAHCKAYRPRMTIPGILRWADAHHQHHGTWPNCDSGPIPEAPGETWQCVSRALFSGLRGLARGSTLARLLRDERGVPHIEDLAPFTVEGILAWADAHHSRTGKWPTSDSGSIAEAPGDTWLKVNNALHSGVRGLEGGSSLARLLAKQRGKYHVFCAARSGDSADRGLGRRIPGPRRTLANALVWPDPRGPGQHVERCRERAPRGPAGPPRRVIARPVARRRARSSTQTASTRFDDHANLDLGRRIPAREGRWPMPSSGPIPEAPGNTWSSVASALREGRRGLPGGSSLARLLAEERGVRHRRRVPRFTITQIMTWADAWYERMGDWPTADSGAIPGAGGVQWQNVNEVLRRGQGAVPGGSSLSRLLASERGMVRHPPMSEQQIVAWADAHHRRTGRWPNITSGPIPEASDEPWTAVDRALRKGLRGLPGGSSLAHLLVKRRQVRIARHAAPLTIPKILAWADAFHVRTGRWPGHLSGPIPEAPGETWAAVTSALVKGGRGLEGGTTLTQLLIKRRGISSRSYAPRLAIP